MARSFEFNNTDDVIDLRDVTDRLEELEDDATLDDSERQELTGIKELLDELRGCGGDHDWRGDWYPLTLIRDDYMEDYAREFAEDCGMVPHDLGWPCTCIDWEQATQEFKTDYSTVEIDGVTYWYR